MTKEGLRQTQPSLSISMHVHTFDQPSYWEGYAQQFAEFATDPRLWFCTHAEYGGYRLQVLLTECAVSGAGREMTVQLRRPAVRDLGALVPLTFEVSGVPADEVMEIESVGAVSPVEGRAATTFNLAPASSQQVFSRAGMIANLENRTTLTEGDLDADLPEIGGLVWIEEDVLRVALVNKGSEALHGLRVVLRLPLQHKERIVKIHREKPLAPNEAAELSVPLRIDRDDYRFLMDDSMYAAQVDFECSTGAARLHLFTVVPSQAERDPRYPAYGFLRAGPLPLLKEDIPASQAEILDASATGRDLDLDGGIYPWKRDDPDVPLKLSAEIVNTMPAYLADYSTSTHKFWIARYGLWVLRNTVESDREQEAVLISNPLKQPSHSPRQSTPHSHRPLADRSLPLSATRWCNNGPQLCKTCPGPPEQDY